MNIFLVVLNAACAKIQAIVGSHGFDGEPVVSGVFNSTHISLTESSTCQVGNRLNIFELSHTETTLRSRNDRY